MSLILRYKATTGAGVAALDVGELALNTFDKSLYMGTAGGNELILGAPVPAGSVANQAIRWDNSAKEWVVSSGVTITDTAVTATTFNGALNGNANTCTTATNSLALGGTAAASFATSDFDDIERLNSSAATLTFDNCRYFEVTSVVPTDTDQEIITFVTA